MTGIKTSAGRKPNIILAIVAAIVLTGCDANGNFSSTAGSEGNATDRANRAAPLQGGTVEQDVERPDIFEVTDRGLWDGRPSLGGVWAAHPDVADPERVIMRNPANGESVVGALFRRERENPGPPLQISSDAAEALGILAGAPTEISVIALRREEVTVETTPEVNPVVAGLDAPVTVQENALEPADPVAGAAAAIAAAELAAPDAETATDASTTATAGVAGSIIPNQAEESAPDTLSGPLVQIGVFSVQANADGAAATLEAAGITTKVLPQQAGGRTVWRVVSGPAADTEAQAAMLQQAKDLGFVDAYGFDG